MTSSSATEVSLSIDSPLTIRNIPSAYTRVLDFISSNDVICVDVDRDLDVDASGLQLLASAHAFAVQNGKQIRLAKPADGKLLDVLERAGFLEAVADEQRNFWLSQGAHS
jgi:ABC-type transporter Mla MlaB component